MKQSNGIVILCLITLFISLIFLVWDDELFSGVMALVTLLGTQIYESVKDSERKIKQGGSK